MIDKKAKIFVAGHKGMVGSAIIRKLKNKGFDNLVFKTSNELDLRAQEKVEGVGATSESERDTSEKERDEKIATRVGGFGGVG